MGLDDLVNKGKALFEENKDKIDEALHSQQAEDISDKVLDGAADIANKVTGDKFSDHVENARKAADGAVGTE
ncbi:antitoxin [Plantibacter sp. Mn2098]|uniref:antitoxin n=1 Tax=Plantibacter sp. Mn2098 TaxID=3395266 RepID=UPI003BD11D15